MNEDFESIMQFNGYEDRDIDGDLIPEHWGHQEYPPSFHERGRQGEWEASLRAVLGPAQSMGAQPIPEDLWGATSLRTGAEGHRLDTRIRMPLGTAAPAQGRTASIRGVPAVSLSCPNCGGRDSKSGRRTIYQGCSGKSNCLCGQCMYHIPWDYVTYEPRVMSCISFIVMGILSLIGLLVLGFTS